MSSNIIMPKPQSIPGIIINTYPRESDLLNCVALKARYDLRDINTYHKNIEKKNLEYQKELLNNKLSGNEIDDDMSLENSNLLFEFKMLMNNRNRNNKFKNYMTPIEERQKRFFDYYKNLFNEMTKKGGIKYYTNRIIPNFLKIQKTQKNIQKKIIKSKSVIIKNKFNNNNQNLEKKFPILKESSICEDNNNINKTKKINLLKLSSYKDDKNSSPEYSKKKLPLLKLFSFDEEKNKSLVNNVNVHNKNNINDNDNENDKLNYNKNENNNKKRIGIGKLKIANRSCDNLENKFIFDNNFNPIIYNSSFKILSKRGNIQFNNSILRTKDINQYINPYDSKEVNIILKEINQQRKNYINNIC